MSDENNPHPFIEYLYSLSREQKRGALADLRRGLSEPPGAAPIMFPYVARWVPEEARQTWKEKVYYLVAALFAYYQSGANETGKQRLTSGNFGEHCRMAKVVNKQSESFEMRFASLLKSNPADLPVHLRQMISLLKSADVPINWDMLFHDLIRWNSESQYIQRQWANSYWAYQKPDNDNQSDEQ
jgi:CRISPR system Cascade subunit CasB